ncbi:ABC transporter ATP-binding protein [Bacillus sp. T3]|uniref:ABC transporter ATP-binding protein n=1 Tax=Bacillus sp. T3 TaxID=467262 RepID=UPI0029828F15|nr:ABC transporter ATP-binding protein [Bacillus sp. T3]
MNKTAVQFSNVTFHYQNGTKQSCVPILEDFHLDLVENEFVSIIGPSGCGKSTLFRLITGLEQPVKGTVYLNGAVHETRLGQVGYMPQQDLLMPWRTIQQNVVLPLELKGIKKNLIDSQMLPLFAEFGLTGVEHKYPSELSGGMKQRASFLRTMLTGSNVLLLDEPFSALDAITRLTMQEWLLEQWEKRKKTILFITHDVNEALFLSDRIFVFTETPVSQLQEVKVPLNRPRALSDLNQPEMIRLKEFLIHQLRLKVKL